MSRLYLTALAVHAAALNKLAYSHNTSYGIRESEYPMHTHLTWWLLTKNKRASAYILK